MAIIVNAGRTAIAQSVKNEALFLAWGRGDENWDSERPPEDITQGALLREIGRRVVDNVVYCVGDDESEFVTPSCIFTAVDYPANNLCFSVNFAACAGRVLVDFYV